MLKLNKNLLLILVIVFAGYLSSWFLPIRGSFIGAEGAKLAIEVLQEGVNFFVSGTQTGSAKNIYEAIYYIIMGGSNILFASCFILVVVKSKWCYFLSPLMVMSMPY